MKQLTVAVLCGAIFGAGLTLSGMVNPLKVLNFLDLYRIGSNTWDPSLALVMGGGVTVTVITFRWVLQRAQPVCGDQFQLPTRTHIDSRLLIGSALFGLGWGLAGYCPGPALAAIAFGSIEPVLFVLAMLVGSFVAGQLANRANN
ncbi:MAG TPA: transporter [Gammaproteobacteria bacterium]|nr:transporter [Gammaproteobacteria bacterium]